MAQYVATLINPTRHPEYGKRLYDVYLYQHLVWVYPPVSVDSMRHATVLRDPRRLGQGFFARDDVIEILDDSFSRSHTPSGVKEKKSGLGLMLYSGLSMSASMSMDVDGIYSTADEQRTKEADKWWNDQTKRRFAKKTEARQGGCVDMIHDISPDDISRDVLAQYMEVDEGDARKLVLHDVEPDEVELQVCWYKDMLVQFLRTSRVSENGTILIWNESDTQLNERIRGSWTSPSVEVMLNLKLDNVQDDPTVVIAVMSRLLAMDVAPDRVGQFLRESDAPFSADHLEGQLARQFGIETALAIKKGYGSKQRANRRQDRAWDEFYGSLVESD